MNVQRWIRRREPQWRRLDALLARVEKNGLKSLNAAEVRQLASLYRSASADLARAKTVGAGDLLVRELQQLTVRGYGRIYQGARRQEWDAVRAFYTSGFPATVRETWRETAAATALFGLGFLAAWWYAWQDSAFLATTLPPDLIAQVRDRGELWMGSIVGIEPLASSAIATNNLSVAFATLGGGIVAGLYTGFILLNNGIHIGAAAALVAKYGLAYPFWAFVFPHGSLELPAIFLAGGGGLAIARGLLFPGRVGRLESLRRGGLQAARLTFGIVPLLLVAGAIEGFFSPNPGLPDPLKYLVGILLFALLVLYCVGDWPGHWAGAKAASARANPASSNRATDSSRRSAKGS